MNNFYPSGYLPLSSIQFIFMSESCLNQPRIASLLQVDHYHYISADNPRGLDTSGVAKVMGYYGWKYDGTVCWPAKKERTAITEFWGNPKDWDGGKLNAGLVILLI